MGRKNRNARLEVFATRSKSGSKSNRKFSTKLMLSTKAGLSTRFQNKTLHVSKVSEEKIYKTGEYNPLPRLLMEEFNRPKPKAEEVTVNA